MLVTSGVDHLFRDPLGVIQKGHTSGEQNSKCPSGHSRTIKQPALSIKDIC